MADVSKLLDTAGKERTRRFNPEEAFKAVYANTHMAADLASDLWDGDTQPSRESIIKLTGLLQAAHAAAVGLEEWVKK